MKTLRCAVYTRKSTEDGLEQEFNSLHAQREACEAYILSQRHEGWSLVERHYDDGGFSGGNMERPGLKALLEDVEADRVDVIVVYKVDRLTRSLADFAKIVERLDAKEASFVSVTQAFNTTNSMGRLTLNVLLSFAQFEREVTGERIRDKIAASKKRGLWMGGPVPLGYQVIDRKLVPVPEEAKRVRTIMRRYIASNSANELIEQLEAEGIRTKVQRRTSGPHRGGIPFKRGSLFHLLKNPIYLGKIVHKGEAYDGEHEAIVDEALWDAVQARLMQMAPPRRQSTNAPQKAMLREILTDAHGRPMVPAYATKGSRRYAYYETRKDLAKPGDAPATRWPQAKLEKHLIRHLADLLNDEHALLRLAGLTDAQQLGAMFAAAQRLRDGVQCDLPEATLSELIASVRCGDEALDLQLNAQALDVKANEPLRWSIPLPSRKPFREAKLRIDEENDGRRLDEHLVQLLTDAMDVQALVLASPELSLNNLAKREKRCRKQLSKLLRLSWVSPRVVEAILSGEQPRQITRARLLNSDMPLGWEEQELHLGLTR